MDSTRPILTLDPSVAEAGNTTIKHSMRREPFWGSRSHGLASTDAGTETPAEVTLALHMAASALRGSHPSWC